MKTTTVYVALVALVALVGCGGSSSGGSSFSSSVPSSAAIGSLSDGDKQKLCSDLSAYVSRWTIKAADIRASCGLAGLSAATLAADRSDAGLQAACKTAYDQCTVRINGTALNECNLPGATCTATVGELTECVNAEVAAFDAIEVPSCASLTAASLDDLTNDPASALQPKQPEVCAAVEAKCPDSPN